MLERYFHASTSAIVARGYPIGDHTQTHAPMSRLSMRDQQSELLQDTAAIGDFGAPFPRLFRPPYGLWNATTLKLLKRYRMLMVLWTVDTSDYQSPGVEAIVDSAVRGRPTGRDHPHARRGRQPFARPWLRSRSSSASCAGGVTGWSPSRGCCSTTRRRPSSRWRRCTGCGGLRSAGQVEGPGSRRAAPDGLPGY